MKTRMVNIALVFVLAFMMPLSMFWGSSSLAFGASDSSDPTTEVTSTTTNSDTDASTTATEQSEKSEAQNTSQDKTSDEATPTDEKTGDSNTSTSEKASGETTESGQTEKSVDTQKEQAVPATAKTLTLKATRDTSGTAYAVLDSSGTLSFIRSTETHTNGESGTVTNINGVSYTGTIYTDFETVHYGVPWKSNNSKILKVDFVNTIEPTDTSYWFDGCSSCISFNLDNLVTTNVTSMSTMFENCSSLTSLDLSNFDTSNVTEMGSMFEDCSSLTSLNVSNFDTSKVAYMWEMFHNCSSLTSLNVSNFVTSNAIYMQGMFQNCSSLTSLDLSNFDTSNVTNMGVMFSGCSKLTSLDLSSFNTNKVTDMTLMFGECSKLTNITFGDSFKLPSQYYSNMFPTPIKTASGASSNGKWGLGSETAETSYSAADLPQHISKGTWYAQQYRPVVVKVPTAITFDDMNVGNVDQNVTYKVSVEDEDNRSVTVSGKVDKPLTNTLDENSTIGTQVESGTPLTFTAGGTRNETLILSGQAEYGKYEGSIQYTVTVN